MAIQNFEELNILKRHSEPYEEYFRVMKLPRKALERRIRLAIDMEEAFATFFEVLMMGVIDELTVKQQLMYDIYDALGDEKRFKTDAQKDKYVTDLVNETYRSTVENLAKYPNDYDYTGKTPYWVSNDRAMFIAENEANTVFNSQEYVEAIYEGRTQKMWVTFADDRVRPTHDEIALETIPIDDYFQVGDAIMLYPKDVTSELSTGALHPEEVVNCRCKLLYI